MRILFISGCLEPGRDGVGDYVRSLAGECVRLGNDTFLLSLNDIWVDQSLREDNLLRLGARMSWPNRLTAAQAFSGWASPDIVSLQFVPYSFHAAGLSFALPQILRAIIGKRPVHTMFHELWIGEQVDAPWKTRIVGFCQRMIAESVVKGLPCKFVHTSNPVYVELLKRYGILAKHLPLFGSVPVVQSENLPSRGDNVLRLGMFGSIHPEWSPDEMLIQLRSFRRPIQLSHIGRIGPGESVWMDLTKRYGSEIELCLLGEQLVEKISQFFSSMDFGISTTPLSLIGKSASVAAMLDHGLPVIVNRNDVHFRNKVGPDPISERLIPVDENFLNRLAGVKRQHPHSRLPGIAAQFLSDIGA
jgi:hypothetical protein